MFAKQFTTLQILYNKHNYMTYHIWNFGVDVGWMVHFWQMETPYKSITYFLNVIKWTRMLIFKFQYYNLSLPNVHPFIKPFKPRSKHISKVTNVIYHGGCHLEILKENRKIHMIQIDLSKFRNYHLVKILKKRFHT